MKNHKYFTHSGLKLCFQYRAPRANGKYLEQPVSECKKQLNKGQKPGVFLDIITTLQEVSMKLLGLQRYITITKLRKRVLRRTMLQPCYSRRLEVKSLQTLLVFLQVVICSPDSRVCRRPAHSLSLCRSFSVRPYYSLFQCMPINKSVFPE